MIMSLTRLGLFSCVAMVVHGKFEFNVRFGHFYGDDFPAAKIKLNGKVTDKTETFMGETFVFQNIECLSNHGKRYQKDSLFPKGVIRKNVKNELKDWNMWGFEISKVYPYRYRPQMPNTSMTVMQSFLDDGSAAFDTRIEHWYLILESTDETRVRIEYDGGETVYITRVSQSHLFPQNLLDAINSVENGFTLETSMKLTDFLKSYCKKSEHFHSSKTSPLNWWAVDGLVYYTCQEFVIDSLRILGHYKMPSVAHRCCRSIGTKASGCGHLMKCLRYMNRIYNNKEMPAGRVNKDHFARTFSWYKNSTGKKQYLIPPHSLRREMVNYIPCGNTAAVAGAACCGALALGTISLVGKTGISNKVKTIAGNLAGLSNPLLDYGPSKKSSAIRRAIPTGKLYRCKGKDCEGNCRAPEGECFGEWVCIHCNAYAPPGTHNRNKRRKPCTSERTSMRKWRLSQNIKVGALHEPRRKRLDQFNCKGSECTGRDGGCKAPVGLCLGKDVCVHCKKHVPPGDANKRRRQRKCNISRTAEYNRAVQQGEHPERHEPRRKSKKYMLHFWKEKFTAEE